MTLPPHPSITLHLTDPTSTPILSTARRPSTASALTTLTTTALASHDAATRLGLGAPLHALVEFASGPVQLTSYLHPPSRRHRGRPGSSSTAGATEPSRSGEEQRVNGLPLSPLNTGAFAAGADDRTDTAAPMLLALVVAPGPDELPAARRMAAKLEQLGRDVQAGWAEEEEGEEEVESGEGTKAGD